MVKIILAVEDDVPVRQILAEALGEVAGWAVTVVANGLALLETLASVRPDLILLAVNLPGLDGIALYRRLRERAGMADIPVLFVTTTPERVRHAGLDGNFSTLAKPFRLEALIARVAELLGEPEPEI